MMKARQLLLSCLLANDFSLLAIGHRIDGSGCELVIESLIDDHGFKHSALSWLFANSAFNFLFSSMSFLFSLQSLLFVVSSDRYFFLRV